MYTKNTLNNAARAVARQAVVTLGISNGTQSNLTTSLNCSNKPIDCVYQAVRDSLYNGIDKSQVSVTISGSSSPSAKTGDTISVQVTAPFASVVPKLIKIGSPLSGSASMRFE